MHTRNVNLNLRRYPYSTNKLTYLTNITIVTDIFCLYIDVLSMNQDTKQLRKYYIIDAQTITTNSKL